MTARERLVLLAFFGLILAAAVGARTVFGTVGAVAGAGLGVLAVGRLTRVNARMDARLGAEPATARAFSWRRVLTRAVVHLAVLGVALVLTAVIPFVGDELFVGAAAALTAFPAVVTAAGLRGSLPRRRTLPPAA